MDNQGRKRRRCNQRNEDRADDGRTYLYKRIREHNWRAECALTKWRKEKRGGPTSKSTLPYTHLLPPSPEIPSLHTANNPVKSSEKLAPQSTLTFSLIRYPVSLSLSLSAQNFLFLLPAYRHILHAQNYPSLSFTLHVHAKPSQDLNDLRRWILEVEKTRGFRHGDKFELRSTSLEEMPCKLVDGAD